MKLKSFEIKILRQHWVKDDGKADNNDLCSHGEVFIRLSSEELSNKDSGTWTLSATGLYLLRSLEQDCKLYEFSNQLLPCCGFTMLPSTQKENSVDILGCPNGIDWKIHHKNGIVVLESEKGSKAELPFDEYKALVLAFIKEVENFYGNPKDKNQPDDEFERIGFNLFWSEWKQLKEKWV